MPKNLTINGQVIAEYQIGYKSEKDILFLKIIKPKPDFMDMEIGDYEEYIASIICMVENRQIDAIGYLNV